VPDYLYSFPRKRSALIKQQTAYNNEISILSGVAKWVGFPAAPTIGHARPKEIDDDLRGMGVQMVSEAHRGLKGHTPTLRATMSAIDGLPRQRLAAEEHFFDQNPWANPQHPVHQQQRRQMQRQVSALSCAATPSSTPAAQRRVIDLTQSQGSASMIAEPFSGPNTSQFATLATNGALKSSQAALSHMSNDMIVNSRTPDNVASSEEAFDKGCSLQPDKVDQCGSPSFSRDVSGRESQVPSGLPKPLPFTQAGGTTRASPSIRFPIKVEDAASQTLRRSPILHQYNGSSPVTAGANGHLDRFTA